MAIKAVRTVHLTENGRTEIDIKRFAKVEKIPGGSIEDSQVLNGVMMNKDITHPKMSSEIVIKNCHKKLSSKIVIIIVIVIVIIFKNAITMNNIDCISWLPGASQHWIILTDGSALVSANNLLRNVITEHLTRNIVLTYLGRLGTTATSHRI